MLQEIYNSEHAIKNYIKDLATLHEVCDFRHDRGYHKNERMRDIKILDGFIWLDTCGNAMVKIGKDSYSPICFPNKDDVCPVCGKGWNIYTIEDYITTYDYSNEERHFYHKQCNFINNLNIKQKQFTEIFDAVYPKDYSLKVIPNEYCQCDVCSPWFIFTTPDGDIKIGWRKRVINIEWLDNYKTFLETFESEDTTRGFGKWREERYIHAWNIEKAIEYIGKVKKSIIQ